jgi:hypothetical protein
MDATAILTLIKNHYIIATFVGVLAIGLTSQAAKRSRSIFGTLLQLLARDLFSLQMVKSCISMHSASAWLQPLQK